MDFAARDGARQREFCRQDSVRLSQAAIDLPVQLGIHVLRISRRNVVEIETTRERVTRAAISGFERRLADEKSKFVPELPKRTRRLRAFARLVRRGAEIKGNPLQVQNDVGVEKPARARRRACMVGHALAWWRSRQARPRLRGKAMQRCRFATDGSTNSMGRCEKAIGKKHATS